MTILAGVVAVLAALLHVYIFVLEAFRWNEPSTRRTFGVSEEDAKVLAPMAFNQGFYNLFLAAGPAAGLIALNAGHEGVGRALIIYGCAFMAACGVVLFMSDRRLWRSMIGQSGPPLIAVKLLPSNGKT